MQKRLKQIKVQQALSYIIWKETTYKPLKVTPAKTFFSSLYIIGAICFDECFLFYVINGLLSLLFMKVYRYSDIFLSAMLLLSPQ